jgi:lysozyme
MIRNNAVRIARDFISRWEGYSDVPYRCSAGKWTIGYGHVIKPQEAFTKITQEEGWNLLESDMAWAIDCVDTSVDVELTDEQYAALISLTFNIGCGAFKGSTILKLINAEHIDLAANQFKRWNKAGSKVIQGLTNRRLAEEKLFRGDNDAK